MAGFDPEAGRRTLPAALLAARAAHGGSRLILDDPTREPLSYDRLVLAALVLGRKLAELTAAGERVGVLLPNVNGVAVTLFALMMRGRVPAMLNFTAGVRNLRSACRTARVATVLTSRRFVEQGRLEEVVAGLGEDVRIVYLEDVRAGIGLVDKLRGLLDRARARAVVEGAGVKPDDEAVVLFTSGSEGDPKGVVLSHANILANVHQVMAHVPLAEYRTLLNPLPVFHSYGLTGGLMLGLVAGITVVLYPSPLHFRQVPKLVGEVKADILFGTDTFLTGYARAAEAGDLKSVRIIVAGAERVKDETRALWDRFGTVILEGYGATECAPVIAFNQPEANRPRSVGRFLPAIEWRLEPVAGIHEGGRLAVRGPNVMKGYLLPDGDGSIVPPEDGWHDTGDIVEVSDDGYVTIKGRAKRFAKLGGEMVPLGAIEALASGLWPDASHVAVTLPDARKGEQVVLVSDEADADREALLAYAREQGVPELWVPRAVLIVAQIPVLGSGKVDYTAARHMAETSRSLL